MVLSFLKHHASSYCYKPSVLPETTSVIMTFSVWPSNIWLTSSPVVTGYHVSFSPQLPSTHVSGSLESKWCYLWNKLWIIVLCPRVRGNLFKPSIQDGLARDTQATVLGICCHSWNTQLHMRHVLVFCSSDSYSCFDDLQCTHHSTWHRNRQLR